MCIIMSKPLNMAFPEEAILKNCWDNNPDMGGFMYALNDKVYIKKGFKTWKAFKDALNRSRELTGDNIPYVCHFRISTQGYDTSCCQPFPMSGNMNKLKKRKAESNIGVAHNGILDITSDGAKDYSDTMKFITDFMVNIVRSYDWWKDERTVRLMENLIQGSRFAVLDKNGHCELLGEGWEESNGCFFSNKTYSYKKYTFGSYGGCSSYWNPRYVDSDDYWDDYGSWFHGYSEPKKEEKTEKKSVFREIENQIDWLSFWNYATHSYEFDSSFCPYTEEDDDSYCYKCDCIGQCPYTASCGLSKKA